VWPDKSQLHAKCPTPFLLNFWELSSRANADIGKLFYSAAKADSRKCDVRIARALLEIAKKGRCERPFLCQQNDDIYR
jgi:hypothetical protein